MTDSTTADRSDPPTLDERLQAAHRALGEAVHHRLSPTVADHLDPNGTPR
ncbi:hypothetical protein ACFWIA_28780 [Streptomyces sp. NPDC127068]